MCIRDSLYRWYILDHDTAFSVLFAKRAFAWMLLDEAEQLVEGLAFVVRTFGISDEKNAHLSFFQNDFFHT